MTRASAELQKAVWTRLAGDAALGAMLGGPRVFDVAPAGTAFPYVSFGRETSSDWSTATERGSEHLFSLHVWARGGGRLSAQTIAERVRALLDGAPLALTTMRLVDLRFRSSEGRLLEELKVQQVALRFRALVEAA